MEAFYLSSSSSIVPRTKVGFVAGKHRVCLPLRVHNMVYCQGGGSSNAIKSSNMSSVVTTGRAADQGSKAALMEAGSLLLAPNGNAQPADTVGMKDLVSYGGSSTALVEKHDDGIGIVKFLRGKSFLITGGTGFLGKGIRLLAQPSTVQISWFFFLLSYIHFAFLFCFS